MYKLHQLETHISTDLAAQLLMLILFLTFSDPVNFFLIPDNTKDTPVECLLGRMSFWQICHILQRIKMNCLKKYAS